MSIKIAPVRLRSPGFLSRIGAFLVPTGRVARPLYWKEKLENGRMDRLLQVSLVYHRRLLMGPHLILCSSVLVFVFLLFV